MPASSIIIADYCLTTILKNAEKPGSRCSATVPGFLSNSDQFCAESMKRLRRKGFAFDRLITPTGSLNPTKLWYPNPCAARVWVPYFSYSVFTCVSGRREGFCTIHRSSLIIPARSAITYCMLHHTPFSDYRCYSNKSNRYPYPSASISS